MTEPDAMNHHAAETLQRVGQTAGAQVAWLVLKVLVTTFVAGSIALATGYVRDMRDDIKVVAQKTEAQDKAQALTDQRVDNLQRVSDATVLTLQQMAAQINDNRYDIRTLKDDSTKGAHR